MYDKELSFTAKRNRKETPTADVLLHVTSGDPNMLRDTIASILDACGFTDEEINEAIEGCPN